ncbi:MAG: hypothetical protein ACI8ZB_003251 [Desulforhopalus sp.]|jgi:hypothetical protein
MDTILLLEKKSSTYSKPEQMNLRAIEPPASCLRVGSNSIYHYSNYPLFVDFNTGNLKSRINNMCFGKRSRDEQNSCQIFSGTNHGCLPLPIEVSPAFTISKICTGNLINLRKTANLHYSCYVAC